MPGAGGTDINYNWPNPWDFDVDSNFNAVVDSSVEVVGDQQQPVTLKLEPVTLDTTTRVVGNEQQPISLKIAPVDLTTTLKGDPQAPISTRSEIEFSNLPRLTFDELITTIKTITTPTLRIHFPIGLNFAFSFFPLNVLGYDAATFSICGEQQIITEEFVPNRFERCDVDCETIECEPITAVSIDD